MYIGPGYPTNVQRCLLNFGKHPAKYKRKPPVTVSDFSVSICIGVIFRLELGSLFVSSRRTLYDLYCPYFSPEVIVKFTRWATGHFVTLTRNRRHLSWCISGHMVPTKFLNDKRKSLSFEEEEQNKVKLKTHFLIFVNLNKIRKKNSAKTEKRKKIKPVKQSVGMN